MPYAKLKADLLAARELRDAALRHALNTNRQTVIQLSLNLPGADKKPDGSSELFRWGEGQLLSGIPLLEKLAENTDGLGPWAIYTVNSASDVVKQQTLSIEESDPAGRLLDIDVYDPRGVIYDRAKLGLQQRRCFVCTEPARDCIRLQRHSAEQLKARIDELLNPFRT